MKVAFSAIGLIIIGLALFDSMEIPKIRKKEIIND